MSTELRLPMRVSELSMRFILGAHNGMTSPSKLEVCRTFTPSLPCAEGDHPQLSHSSRINGLDIVQPLQKDVIMGITGLEMHSKYKSLITANFPNNVKHYQHKFAEIDPGERET